MNMKKKKSLETSGKVRNMANGVNDRRKEMEREEKGYFGGYLFYYLHQGSRILCGRSRMWAYDRIVVPDAGLYEYRASERTNERTNGLQR